MTSTDNRGCAPATLALCFWVASWIATAAVAQDTNPAAPAPAQRGKPMEQVDISAQRAIERRTLDHVIIPNFVRSHGATGGKYDQVARWEGHVCPTVVGLEPKYGAYVASRIKEVAASIGGPAAGAADCVPNVEILFTSGPQATLDYIAKNNEAMLGYHYTAQLKQLATFNHPIQAWYVTASRNGDGTALVDSPAAQSNFAHKPLSLIKSEYSSEFFNVLVIVDADKLGDHSLKSITEYITLLVLTRTTSLDACNELPSILDLLSSGCGQRSRPTTITTADLAYLKALYSTDLDNSSNLARGDMRSRMMKQVAGP